LFLLGAPHVALQATLAQTQSFSIKTLASRPEAEIAAIFQRPAERKPDVPYVPTPDQVVRQMLRLADVNKEDVVYDLGCGDGRIVITAAKEFGARGVGVDIDPKRIRQSIKNARKAGVADRVKFVQQDLFETDLSEATVVTLYLLPTINIRLREKLLRELRPGARVVSHDYWMGAWEADQTIKVKGPGGEHTIYYWVVPAGKQFIRGKTPQQ
jgi:SAM-dependent methyltransferase